MLHPFLRQALVALFLEQGDSARWLEVEWVPEEVWTGRKKVRLWVLLGKNHESPFAQSVQK
jgi:hypothetical protein